MKRKSVTAIIIAVLFVFSFFLFRAYRNTDTTTVAGAAISLTGRWKLDSAYAPADAPDSIRQIAIALNSRPTGSSIYLNFKPDSTVDQIIGRDSIDQHYYSKGDTLYLDSGTGYRANLMHRVSDSLFSFTTSDNLSFFLKRN
ncbi:MAG: hypothetical protein JO301_09535 [Chitinophagaceae bacterium]|nr:hypothetical protein [Chitinophagaceae bacterium]